MVKCVICGEIFEDGLEVCPVCGVGKEFFESVAVETPTFQQDTNETIVIIGNGVAALASATALRERNKTCSIIMIGNESELSYHRPMLTKSMLNEFNPTDLLIHDENWYAEQSIENRLNIEGTQIESDKNIIHLSNGECLSYDQLVIATGAECFMPPIDGIQKEGVMAIRRISDIIQLNKQLNQVRDAVVIGGGILGLEAAWELSKAGCKVHVLELAPQIMGRQLDEEGSSILKSIIASVNIDVTCGVPIKAIAGKSSVEKVILSDGTVIPAQLVIISAGIAPNIALAKDAGLNVERSIVVNDFMQTSHLNIYAVGDCAQFKGINLGNYSQAKEMGTVAGANIAKDTTTYQINPSGLSFNGLNTSLYVMGDNGKDASKTYSTKEFKDLDKLTYEKYYFIEDILCGFILIGDTSKMVKLNEAIEKKTKVNDLF